MLGNANHIADSSGQAGYVVAGVGLLERERARLHSIVATYGLLSPQALKQSVLVDNIVMAVVRGKLE